MPATEPSPQDTIPIELLLVLPKDFSPTLLVLTTLQVASLLNTSDATLRGWISRGQFPPKDGELNGKTPYWKLTTLLDYVRHAPGGRLPYQVQ